MPKNFSCYKIDYMNKKIFAAIIFLGLLQGVNLSSPCYANYYEHYSKGQQFYFNAQYSSAIDEFKQALSQRSCDNSSRIGFSNSRRFW